MARAGRAAFTAAEHAELIRLRDAGLKPVELAARFGVSVPTVYKWLSLPLGAHVGRWPKKPDTAQDGAA
jgi:DNA-directed RNA polymerase specialized sigma24 family protein